jgi:hypothetical protein
MKDIWFGGPELVKTSANKLTNLFWKETLTAFSKILDKIPYVHPQFFLNLNIFHAKLFSGQGIFIRKEEYPDLWGKSVTQVGDFFNYMINPPTILQPK